jgi:hypothetical protein
VAALDERDGLLRQGAASGKLALRPAAPSPEGTQDPADPKVIHDLGSWPAALT